MNRLSGIETEKKYPEEVRKFALTLRFYSQRAYNYVRDKFHNNLPHPRTILKWYQQSDVQTKSGICTRSFELIKDKVDELKKEGKKLYVGLIFDEMHIRQHLQWMRDKKFSGFITFGKVSEKCETLPLATQALVFLLSGINVPFHMPIAYYFIESLDAIDKTVLVTSIIQMLNDAGVSLLTITGDGISTNISAYEMLGGSYELDDLRPYFTNPGNQNAPQIFTFLDPPHMLKLIRNTLGSRKTIYDRFGRAIEWEYFVKLASLDGTESMISHKMTKAHINYEKKNKMKVSLAAQTFSQSVAKSFLSLVDRQYPGFENASATAEFCLRIDQTFDILNSDVQRTDNLFKSPVNEKSVSEIWAFIDDTIDYLKKLTFEPFEDPIVASELKVGFKGMIIGLDNVKLIFTNFVQTKLLDHFPVRSICQCSLESLFSRCRSCSMLGFNTNPSVNQFESIMRKVVVNNEITSSAFANCSDQLDILYVSSHIKRIVHNPPSANSNDAVSNHASSSVSNDLSSSNSNESNINEISSDDEQNDDDDEQNNEQREEHLESNTEIGIAYIASEIDKRVQCNGVLKCYLCSLAIAENVKLSMDSFPATKSAQVPCRSTYEICTAAYHILEPRILKSTFNFDETVSLIFSKIRPESLFSNTNFIIHSNSDHRHNLIKYIIECYISIRAAQIARKISINCQFKRSESKKENDKAKNEGGGVEEEEEQEDREIEKRKQLQKKTPKQTQKQKKIAHFESR